MSCIAYPEKIDPRRSFQEYTVASVTSADSPQSLCCERLLRSLNLVKPAAWRLELRVAKFLCCFHCKLLDNRTIEWSELFGFLLEPFPYSIIHVQVLWSTVTLIALENPLSYSSLTRVFCFRMLLTCVFRPNFSATLYTPVNPLLFSYSSTIWKCFSKGNSFNALGFYTSCSATFWQLLAFRATFEQLMV